MSTKIQFITVLLLMSTFTITAQSTRQRVTTETMNYIQMELDEVDYSSCLGMNRTTFESKYRSLINEYFEEEDAAEYAAEEIEEYGQEGMNNLIMDIDGFAKDEILLATGISEDEFYDCQSKIYRDEMMMGEDDRLESLDQVMNAMAAHAQSNLNVSDVGLPVYPNHTVMSYFTKQQSEEMLKQMNPSAAGPFLHAAIFNTVDDYHTVVSYYTSKLNGFSKSVLDDRTVAFCAEAFDFDKFLTAEGMAKWNTIESVWIEKIDLGLPQGDVKIEIHWK